MTKGVALNEKNPKDVWIFTEIQDHVRIQPESLELLTKGKELAAKLGGKLVSVVFALDVEQYLDEIKAYGPDVIYYSSNLNLKHYNGSIFPDMIENLMKTNLPSVFLFPSTEAGADLAPRLAQRFGTGLTAHCSDLDIIDSKEYDKKLLLMKRPAFSGNMFASIICPKTYPQMATVQQGIFKKQKSNVQKEIQMVSVDCPYELSKLKVVNIEAPTRWTRLNIPLEKAFVVLTGGRGLRDKETFDLLYELAELLNAEVGATRIPVFEGWCSSERMIGQTGKIVKPQLYIGFGVSGQIQHTSSIVDSKRIISVNTDPDASLHEISDYVIEEDAKSFLLLLIKKLKEEKTFK